MDFIFFSLYDLSFQTYSNDNVDMEKELVNVAERKGLKGTLKEDKLSIKLREQVSFTGDVKLRVTQKSNELAILKHEKYISSCCDVYKLFQVNWNRRVEVQMYRGAYLWMDI